jgi:SAM-dependent methyltransferase
MAKNHKRISGKRFNRNSQRARQGKSGGLGGNASGSNRVNNAGNASGNAASIVAGKSFWNREYQTAEHITLSHEPSEDLEKFCRWHERNFGRTLLNPTSSALDLGCGNGRNLIYLAREYGMRGIGYDISEEAILQAEEMATQGMGMSKQPSMGKTMSRVSAAATSTAAASTIATFSSSFDLNLTFEVQSIAVPLPAANASANIVLDMMSSHFLRQTEREQLLAEILRILKPVGNSAATRGMTGGWLFFKGFLLDEDLNAKRMLREYPADEADTYIHPRLGVAEHVWTEQSLRDFFEPHFEIHKLEKSHKHMSHGRAFKRRTICAYLEKK